MEVESYKFWDIVELWGRELLEHDITVSYRLATGVIKEGLRFQSTDPKWLAAGEELLSYPYVGYAAHPGETPIIIRAEALEHLLAVASGKREASKNLLQNEVVTRSDFMNWLVITGRSLPRFWFKPDLTNEA